MTKQEGENFDSYTYLVEPQQKLIGNKLPSKKDVLGFFMFQHMNKKLPVRQTATLTCFEIMTLWSNAGIKTRQSIKCIEQIEKIYKEFVGLKNSKNRKSAVTKSKEKLFVATLEDLFDIAHIDALHHYAEEVKQF